MTRQSRGLNGIALFVALIGGGSCIDPSGPKDWVCTSNETLLVRVGPGLKPRISWTPDCTAFLLLVFDSAAVNEDPLWAILSKDTVSSQVPASVIYGSPPPNTMEGVPARPLQAGRTYQVFVALREGDVIGLINFTP